MAHDHPRARLAVGRLDRDLVDREEAEVARGAELVDRGTRSRATAGHETLRDRPLREGEPWCAALGPGRLASMNAANNGCGPVGPALELRVGLGRDEERMLIGRELDELDEPPVG